MLLPAIAGGCGSKNEDRAPVQGTVTYQGQPLANALVVFMPETPDKLPATGLTNASGRYQLMTMVAGDGASIGKHRVTITARAEEKKPPDGQLLTGLQGDAASEAAPLIPERYFMPDTSGLTAVVTDQGITADFELKD
jgi:hypothetical protein